MHKLLKLSVILSAVALANFSNTAHAGMKYECSRYVNGDYKGYTTVVANNKEEAEIKAKKKFKNDLNKKVDYVKCK